LTILIRAKSNAEFRRLLLIDAVNELLTRNLEADKVKLRDYINATLEACSKNEKIEQEHSPRPGH
jgi:hypothetical protein